MKPWTWKELWEMQVGGRPGCHEGVQEFIDGYGKAGAFALELALLHPDNPNRGVSLDFAHCPAPFCVLHEDDCDECSLGKVWGSFSCTVPGTPYDRKDWNRAFNDLIPLYRKALRG